MKTEGGVMGEHLEDRDALLSGIQEDASREGERLVQEARAAAEERRKAAGTQTESILREAQERIAKQGQMLQRQAESGLRMEEKRQQLKARERVIAQVEQEVRQRLKGMIGEKGYRKVLLDWIAEAAVGLNAPQASVNASPAERKQLDDKLLREAEGRVRRLTGADVKLSLAEGPPVVGQGIVLMAADGRVEFNNQVATRLLRLQSEIRKVIYKELFG
jgi:vacuolar-type H+-ATPase subunit E/Vma4